MHIPSRRNFLRQIAGAALAAPFVARLARSETLTSVGNPKVRTAIREALEQAPLGSTHEHTFPEPVRLAMKFDLFSMFGGYASRDLTAPGPWARLPGQVWNQNLSILERWKLFEPYWQR